jgi:hypothetical protein
VLLRSGLTDAVLSVRDQFGEDRKLLNSRDVPPRSAWTMRRDFVITSH